MSDFSFGLLTFSIGILALAFVGYMNWYGNIKHNSVEWIGGNGVRYLFLGVMVSGTFF